MSLDTDFDKFLSNSKSHFSRNYELQKYEYYRDLDFDYQKYLQDTFHEDQSESNSEITYTSKQKNSSEKHNVDELFKQYKNRKLVFEKSKDI